MTRSGTAVAAKTSEESGVLTHHKVYYRSMTRTNIDIDDELIERVMQIYRLPSKREAVDLALRKLAGEPMSREEMLEMEGVGWGGDLDEIRRRDEIPEL